MPGKARNVVTYTSAVKVLTRARQWEILGYWESKWETFQTCNGWEMETWRIDEDVFWMFLWEDILVTTWSSCQLKCIQLCTIWKQIFFKRPICLWMIFDLAIQTGDVLYSCSCTPETSSMFLSQNQWPSPTASGKPWSFSSRWEKQRQLWCFCARFFFPSPEMH